MASPQKKSILLEGLFVALVGMFLALAANQLSPSGVKLTRDYFFAAQPTNTASLNPTNIIGATNFTAQTAHDKLANDLKAKGLNLADSNQVFKLYNDPRFAMELVVFIDARDDKHYQEGHVPGAYQLDYYKPETYLPAVLQACPNAEQIVVYCNGGDCEDSQFAALLLAGQGGVAKEKLFVYGGGMSEWKTNGWPVELGARKSGNLVQPITSTNGGAK